MRTRLTPALAWAAALCLLAAAQAPDAPHRYMPLSGPPLEYSITETTTMELPELGPVEKVDTLGQVSTARAADTKEIAEVGAGSPALVVEVSRRDGGDKEPPQEILTYYSATPEWIRVHAVRGPDGVLERYAPPLQHLPRDVAAGAAWEMGTLRQQGLLFPTRGSIIGVERALTDAEAFDNCLHVRFTVDSVGGSMALNDAATKVKSGTSRIDDWYAPGIGLVREEATSTIVLEVGGRDTRIGIKQVLRLKKSPK
jgi:hypothetical protein